MFFLITTCLTDLTSFSVDHGSWFDYTRGWLDESQSDNVYLIFYEDMKKDLRQEILKLCHFLEKDLPVEIVDRIVSHTEFDSMKRNPMTNHLDVYSINSKVSPLLRKGKTISRLKMMYFS